ncbi:hypothetical protein [Salana multivorans]|uniref:hypothetical protein n=1 Tax=Salana multivorans TaxID=120377 RepID=UPI00249132BF|nr:hypothetical protein [Salana multivorans]
MALNELELTVPLDSDAFDPSGDMRALATSLGGSIIVPVANTTARSALVAGLGWTPTPARPLYVHRADAGVGRGIEYTTDGTTWTRPGSAYAAPAGNDFASVSATVAATIETSNLAAASITLTGPQRVLVFAEYQARPVGNAAGELRVYQGSTLSKSRSWHSESTAYHQWPSMLYPLDLPAGGHSFFVRGYTSGGSASTTFGRAVLTLTAV